ncbi:DUF4249 domain-containing protein [Aequorivita xiaoshiensis]|uniref:DUF4249 domain-containing protein n=1 Tax=Aequorivita xiaoshiensis TaxID=2874476 RepID=A0A9X1R2N3_9FLAO|nr:DUF4249 domain-containing protein [Aequorivita xiaoshiensis]MCG2430448.1 DUF4249 domain-containing protein [Aequorivita xiaoshiensis]
MKAYQLYTILFAIFLSLWACTEPYEIETVDFESVLVVESTITDEFKLQTVKLSKTTTLENPEILYENNATVVVNTSTGSTFDFIWDDIKKHYISEIPFRAEPNVTYTLSIITQDGKRYSSSEVVLPPSVEMTEVYTERVVNTAEHKDGAHVLVNTEDPTGSAKYFRYEYEETYKIVAPNPSPYYAEIVNYDFTLGTYEVILTPREPEEICYTTEYSTGIIQTSTTELNDNSVNRFPVKYLSKNDAKMQTRYSILVKQYVQSVDAFTFYKVIKELGSIESLLSQSQPGYVAGNITSENNPNTKVIGFFEASSMTSKRIYFNYEDVGLEKPPYFVDCEVLTLDYNDATVLDDDPNERETLYQLITYNDYQVLSVNTSLIYQVVQPECSVCTYFSSNVRPDFWID